MSDLQQPAPSYSSSEIGRASESVHVTVMLREATDALQLSAGMTVVDGTLGGGGHTRRLAELVGPSGRVLSFDADPLAVHRMLQTRGELPIEPIHANFRELPRVLAEQGIGAVDGILLDLGLSSDQLADQDRGFSFASSGPLDLRFDPTQGSSASELLNRMNERDLADLIYQYGEEKLSRRIAREIVAARGKGRESLSTEWTAEKLAALIARCVPRSKANPIHPATRTFQALRIAVNGELESLELILRESPSLLKPGGRIAIISFHSLEDRRVKEAFRDDPFLEPLTRKPILPSENEVLVNSRSRSAKLRAAVRLNDSDVAQQSRVPKRFLGQ